MELKLNLNWLFIHVEGLFEGVASSPSPRDVTDAGLTYKWPLSFQGDTIKSSRTWPEITTNAFEMGQATYAQKGCRNRRFGWSIFAVSQCKQGGEKRRGASRHRGVTSGYRAARQTVKVAFGSFPKSRQARSTCLLPQPSLVSLWSGGRSSVKAPQAKQRQHFRVGFQNTSLR